MKTVQVFSPVAGFGNRLDLDLVCDLLERGGFSVTRAAMSDRSKLGRGSRIARRLLSLRGRFDLNLFLAPIFPEWLPLARKNVLVPNAEGFAQVNWLKRIDLVLAKTRMTEEIFRAQGCRTEFVSFTSSDHLDEAVPRDYTRFFHSCSSQFKGTRSLLETWSRHPEWPELVAVINNNDNLPAKIAASNIRLIRRSLSDQELRQLQNSISLHLCPSEAEGFGHYIMEAMSCRAVTFTTDGPPMNEVVRPDRGILLDRLEKTAPMRLSHRYFFDPKSLEREVPRILQMDAATRLSMGEAARTFFLKNDVAFREKFVQVLRDL